MGNHKKRSLKADCMYPKYAILDPELTLSLPPRITAISGLDAMAHAIEAAYSNRSTATSDAHALPSLQTIVEQLENAVFDGTNRRARERLLHSSLEAGLAIAETSTAAAHSVSYPLTIHYGVPHGHAVGLLAPEFLVYNSKVSDSDCRDPRGAAYVVERCKLIAATVGCKDVFEARDRLRLLIAKFGLETHLRDLGVTDIGLVAKEGLDPDRVTNQPRTVTEQSVRSILEEIQN
jgi:alcohol dehydrogenase class IV